MQMIRTAFVYCSTVALSGMNFVPAAIATSAERASSAVTVREDVDAPWILTRWPPSVPTIESLVVPAA